VRLEGERKERNEEEENGGGWRKKGEGKRRVRSTRPGPFSLTLPDFAREIIGPGQPDPYPFKQHNPNLTHTKL
jgi:hypothetical protein